MLHHEINWCGTDRPWEHYTGAADGPWTTIYTGSGLNGGNVGAYFAPTAQATVGMIGWTTGHFGSTSYFQAVAISGTSVSALGSIQSIVPNSGLPSWPCRICFADSAWVWGSWSGFYVATSGAAVGFSYTSAGGLGATQPGPVVAGTGAGLQPHVSHLDSTRAIISGGVSGPYAGAYIQQRAGATMGTAGALYNPNNENYGWFYAAPVTPSVSLCNTGHSAAGTVAMQIGAISHPSATISALVAPITVATVTGSLYVTSYSEPLDGMGSVPGRVAWIYTDGNTGMYYAILTKWDGTTVTAGSPVALTGLGTLHAFGNLVAVGSGTILAMEGGGNFVPLYYDQTNQSNLTLTISPVCLANGAPFNFGLGANSGGAICAAVSNNRLIAYGSNNTSNGNGTVLQCKIISNGML
jgi:hypothetical protein